MTERATRGSGSTGRIIGIMALLLLVGSAAQGQFIVQPMKVEISLTPGRRHWRDIVLENTSQSTSHVVDLRIADMTQIPDGIWTNIEPDTQITQGPNGEKWALVETADQQMTRVDISKMRSCADWLELPTYSVDLPPFQREKVRMRIDVPVGTRGCYSAAIMAKSFLGLQEAEGMTSAVMLEFLIPVIIEVKGHPMRSDINLEGMGLEFRPQTMLENAATIVTLGIKNEGGTYSRLNGYTRIWGQWGGHWQKITDVKFMETGILPGVKLRLKQDVGRPLPSGQYKIEGFLFVDGYPAKGLSDELSFAGDPRVRSVKVDAALDLNPGDVFIETMPGQQRAGSLTVGNASEETVKVDVEVTLPEHMVSAAVGSLRGDSFGCTDWLEVSPKQFELGGRQRKNVRIISRMPKSGTPHPYCYATIKLTATYADGQGAGVTEARVCVQERNTPGTPDIKGIRMSLAEAAPGRYLVTARFGNFGDTHVLPSCRALLTGLDGSTLSKRMVLASQTWDQTGMMMPLETRNFTGVLDLADVPTGRYRLTAILSHDRGGAVQRQTVLDVTKPGEFKVVEELPVSDFGGATLIEL